MFLGEAERIRTERFFYGYGKWRIKVAVPSSIKIETKYHYRANVGFSVSANSADGLTFTQLDPDVNPNIKGTSADDILNNIALNARFVTIYKPRHRSLLEGWGTKADAVNCVECFAQPLRLHVKSLDVRLEDSPGYSAMDGVTGLIPGFPPKVLGLLGGMKLPGFRTQVHLLVVICADGSRMAAAYNVPNPKWTAERSQDEYKSKRDPGGFIPIPHDPDPGYEKFTHYRYAPIAHWIHAMGASVRTDVIENGWWLWAD